MKLEREWLLSVLSLLMCSTFGYGQEPQPVVEAPSAVVDGPTGSVVEEPEPVVEERKPGTEDPKAVAEEPDVTEKPRAATEQVDAAQKDLETPVEITNSIGMKLKLIPKGAFLMGSPQSDDKASYWEKPQHKVRITKPFYLSVHEVTQGQWEAVMETRPWSGETHVQEGSDYAASCVSWDDAVAFCAKLSSEEGKTYRLPTEAEWEYACRAGTTTQYHFGDDASRMGDYAWFDGNAWDVDEKYAHRVGQKNANPFGLYDMHGNVCEWCADRYVEDYYSKSPVDDPMGPDSGQLRVLRGGSWGDRHPNRFRCAFRVMFLPGFRLDRYGFRLARTLAP